MTPVRAPSTRLDAAAWAWRLSWYLLASVPGLGAGLAGCGFPHYSFGDEGSGGETGAGSAPASGGASSGMSPGGSHGVGSGGLGSGDSCSDGAQNGDETDVDCGGSCKPCTTGLACASAFDCATHYCLDATCATSLVVDCRCTNCEAATVSSQQMVFSIRNETPETVPLRSFTLRYYFKRDAGEEGSCVAAPFAAGCDSTEGRLGNVQPARPNADSYWEVSFLPSAGDLLASQSSGDTTIAFAAPAAALFDQRNDYSWVSHWGSNPCPTWTLWHESSPDVPAYGSPP